VRGEGAGILEKSHKVETNWKKFNLKQYFLIFTNKQFQIFYLNCNYSSESVARAF